MRPTKARLKKLVAETESRVTIQIEKERSAAQLEYLRNWWEHYDPNWTELFYYYHALVERDDAENRILDFMEGFNATNWRMSRQNHTQIFKDFTDTFLRQLEKEEIPGYEKVGQPFGERRQAVRTQYLNISKNLDTIPAKQGVEYLQYLGLDVSIFEEPDAQLPMVPIDTNKLELPVKEE